MRKLWEKPMVKDLLINKTQYSPFKGTLKFNVTNEESVSDMIKTYRS